MTACKPILAALPDLAARSFAELPAWAATHLAGCEECRRRIEAERLTRAVMAAVAAGPEPPPDFAARVAARLRPVPASRREPELWRSAWRLMPAFGAVVVALFIVYQASALPEAVGLLPTDTLTVGERLALRTATPEPDDVLSFILEGNGR